MIDSFQEKKDDWNERIIDQKILHRDMLRFVMVVLIVMMLGLIYRFENNVSFNHSVKNIEKKIMSGIEEIPVKNKMYFQKIYDSELLNKIVTDFAMVDEQQDVFLGNYIAEKNGYLHSYDFGQGLNEVLLPDYFGENTVITSNNVTLLIQPMGFDEEKSRSLKIDNKLLFDEIYPQTTMIKSFSEKGLKEYIYIKNQNAPYIYNYRLNASDGSKINMENGQIVIVDENGDARIVLNKIKIYDADLILLDNVETQLLGDNILEFRFGNREGLKYPLLVDFV